MCQLYHLGSFGCIESDRKKSLYDWRWILEWKLYTNIIRRADKISFWKWVNLPKGENYPKEKQ